LQTVPWTVYLLRCNGGSLYTGITNDLRRRLAAHRAGTASAYTRARRPVRLAYRETQPDRGAALRREAAIKRLPREGKLALVRTRKGR
jgi:putative endonuclease